MVEDPPDNLKFGIKTKFMVFGMRNKLHNNEHIDLNINGEGAERVDELGTLV